MELEQKPVSSLTNDQIVIRLLYTMNHLSRWLSPVHVDARLQRSANRSERAPKDIVLSLRDEELRVFPYFYAMATMKYPNLDALPPVIRTEEDEAWDRQAKVFEVVAEFRRLRQSTCSLLRSLPDDAWKRDGISRETHNWTIRMLAEYLVLNDVKLLAELDQSLSRSGAREGVAEAYKPSVLELQKLAR